MSATAISDRRCDVCGGQLAVLPAPSPERAMLSDGRVLPATLAKVSCLACGCAAHLEPVDDVIQRYSYNAEYSLPTAAPAADFDRARGYMDLLSRHAGKPSRILEMGCGSGRLLIELAAKWPDAQLAGVDPALPDGLPRDGRLRFVKGGFDAAPEGHFDLIVSVNVIEHVPAPGDLLRAIAKRLAPNGLAIVVCPAAQPPNVELLLFDHLYSLTAQALNILGRQAGLAIDHYEGSSPDVGDFQLMTFRHGVTTATEAANVHPAPEAIHHARAVYLDTWRRMPDVLQAQRRPGRPLVMFGAGQMAAFLRAYAPSLWRETAFLVMDNPDDAWSLGKAVRGVDTADLARVDADLLIATAPASQAKIAARLDGQGLRVIRFDDLVSA